MPSAWDLFHDSHLFVVLHPRFPKDALQRFDGEVVGQASGPAVFEETEGQPFSAHAALLGSIATFAFGNIGIGIVIGLAMIINLLAASSSGVFLPIIMRYFHIDPALAGGVVLTTITDIVGFAAVLGLASLLLPLL